MRDIIQDIDQWLIYEVPIAIATVISTWGSAPRRVGAKLAMTTDGKMSGSVSGGCVEGAVFEAGVEVLVNRQSKLLHFGVADETAWDVGLACGGTIDVFVEPLDPVVYNFLHGLIEEDESFAVVTIISGPANILGKKLVIQRGGRIFGSIDPVVDGIIAATARTTLTNDVSNRHVFELPDLDYENFEAFIEIIQPAPTLIVIGGVHIAIGLTAIAKNLGYRTIVIDPRRAFSSLDRFPDVDRLIQAWPDEAFRQIKLTPNTAIASLSHDPKIDDPALKIALANPAFYVGALGSQKTHRKRRNRLAEDGINAEQLDRIHGPIGLKIGAQTPEEIALAIMAEIVAASHKQ
jgi:xanthine dehydrogenase accessory factor